MSNKSFQELNLSDRFLFPAALEDPITCRLILECIVEEEIGELAVKVEYTRTDNSELKCIRLDVYAKDVITEVSYNLEMQNKNEYNLPLRSRYYQAQLDSGSLEPGDKYTDLKPLYVIFICNFDPFGQGLYRYTFSMQCEERELPLNDGVKRIFFSTKGKNDNEVPQILIDFLGYLNDSTDSYVEQNADEKVREIHERIKVLKKNRAVEERYMHYLYVDKLIEEKENALKKAEETLKEAEKKADEAEKKADEAARKVGEVTKESQDIIRKMLFDSISKLGIVSELIRERIEKEEDINILRAMHKVVVKAESMEQFEDQMTNL